MKRLLLVRAYWWLAGEYVFGLIGATATLRLAGGFTYYSMKILSRMEGSLPAWSQPAAVPPHSTVFQCGDNDDVFLKAKISFAAATLRKWMKLTRLLS